MRVFAALTGRTFGSSGACATRRSLAARSAHTTEGTNKPLLLLVLRAKPDPRTKSQPTHRRTREFAPTAVDAEGP